MRGAWTDYEPAVPVTAAGFVWAAIGFFLAGGLVSLIRQLAGIARKSAWKRATIDAADQPRPPEDGRGDRVGARPIGT